MSSDVKVPRLLTVKQLAKETGVPVWRWHEMLQRGEGPPSIRFGKTYRVSELALARWLEAQQAKKVEP
jgi:excisionase family DNA binding protein